MKRQELALEINALLSDVISERHYRRGVLEAAAAPLLIQKRKLQRREAALAEIGVKFIHICVGELISKAHKSRNKVEDLCKAINDI